MSCKFYLYNFLVYLKIYTRFSYVLHSFTKLLKENAIQKFHVYVQFLMMMEEVWKLDMLIKISFGKRGLWVGALCEPRPCVTTAKESYSKLIFGSSVS